MKKRIPYCNFLCIMNISNNELSKSFSVAATQGINASEVSLVGQNNNFLIKTQVKSLSTNYGIAILANSSESHQCFLAIYRSLDSRGAKLVSQFRESDVFPPIVTFDDVEEHILVLSSTGIEAFILNDPEKSSVYKSLASPHNEIFSSPTLAKSSSEQVVIMDSLKVNNDKIDSNAFFILTNFNRALTDTYLNGAVDSNAANRAVANATDLPYFRSLFPHLLKDPTVPKSPSIYLLQGKLGLLSVHQLFNPNNPSDAREQVSNFAKLMDSVFHTGSHWTSFFSSWLDTLHKNKTIKVSPTKSLYYDVINELFMQLQSIFQSVSNSIIDPEDVRAKLQKAFWTDADSASLNAWSNRIQSYSFNEQHEQLQRQQAQLQKDLTTNATFRKRVNVEENSSHNNSHQKRAKQVTNTLVNIPSHALSRRLTLSLKSLKTPIRNRA